LFELEQDIQHYTELVPRYSSECWLHKDGRALIKNVDHDRNSQIICSTILSFSSELEMQTVAEFVHNDGVLESVKDLGFDYLQGFYLGEPVPIYDLLNN